IVSNNQTVTENLSQIADFAIKEIPPSLPSYVKYTNHFLRILHSITDLPKDAILCTLDVSSLYTNIPTDEGIEATLEAYARLHDSAKPLDSHFLRKALELTLMNNCFEFNNEFYLQINGTAMGTKVAPHNEYVLMCNEESAYLDNQEKPYI